MRFREMHQYLEAYKGLSNSAPARRYTLRAALERLARVPALEKEATALLDEQILGGSSASSTAAILFDRKIEHLREKAQLLHEVIAGTIQDEDANSVAVRIPPPKDLNELKGIVHELQQVFEHPVQAVLGADAGDVRLQGFDVGSEWLYIAYAAGSVPLVFIGQLLRVANWWRDQTLDAERKRVQLDVDNIAAEALRTHAQVEKQLLDFALARHVAKVLSEEGIASSGGSTDQEMQSRTTRGVQVWADMLGRGAAAVPALNASPKVWDAFPTHPSLSHAPSNGPKLLQPPSAIAAESPTTPTDPDAPLPPESDASTQREEK
jgi:hypothetical protein